MTYVDSRAVRKERGAFFTPEPLARFIADWALRDPSDRVLEPSCGEAVFLHCAASRLMELGAPPARDQLLGVDLHEASIWRAQDSLQAAGFEARLTVSDFFDYQAPSPVDAVIGNPPYIRYQDFHGAVRAKALRCTLTQGVRLTSLASSWAAFTVHAASFLTEGGRLGLVLPAELLSVNYASGVREFLLRSFARVRLVLFTNRVFPDVQEKVMLLLAEGYTRTGPGVDHFELAQLDNVVALASAPQVSRWKPAAAGDKWTPALSTCPDYDAAVSPTTGAFTELINWGRVTLGAVTGANRFFALGAQRANELGLTDDDVVPLSPPGSRHLRGLVLDTAAMHALAEADKPTVLFSPAHEPSEAAWTYISAGEATGVHQAYKCRVRNPWWRVPLPPIADLFVTYMNDTTVAFCANDARVHHLEGYS
ncbi:N-6 DNA methylase [Actinomyces sp.]|uniref:N-6 DNA methylase n=1 Tax=Actinomyces sp. TaxID=29317 RepID=UPI0026DA70CC|nr:N-6 DNA methylase [Actinomyces sp.]MDO4901054.1 N-6 DNA methylase [Actinomyces sp.]